MQGEIHGRPQVLKIKKNTLASSMFRFVQLWGGVCPFSTLCQHRSCTTFLPTNSRVATETRTGRRARLWSWVRAAIDLPGMQDLGLLQIGNPHREDLPGPKREPKRRDCQVGPAFKTVGVVPGGSGLIGSPIPVLWSGGRVVPQFGLLAHLRRGGR